MDPAENNEYKVLKLVDGADVICKVVEEYADALTVERPFAVKTTQHFDQDNQQMVDHTGFGRWMNFTNDKEFVIFKKRILSMGNLAPEVRFYYKHLVSKLMVEEQNQIQTEEEALAKMKHLQDAVAELSTDESNLSELQSALGKITEDDDRFDTDSNVLYFRPTNKDKLH